jgi:hypothetical protein
MSVPHLVLAGKIGLEILAAIFCCWLGTTSYTDYVENQAWVQGICTMEVFEIAEEGVGKCNDCQMCQAPDGSGEGLVYCDPPEWVIQCGMHVSISYTDEGVLKRVPTPAVGEGYSSVAFERGGDFVSGKAKPQILPLEGTACDCGYSGVLHQIAKKDGESCSQLANALLAAGKKQFDCAFRLEKNEEFGTVVGVKTPPGVAAGSIHEEHTGSSERQTKRKMAIGISSVGLIVLLGIMINDTLMMRLPEDELRAMSSAKRGLNRSVEAGDAAELRMLGDGDEEDNYEY